MSHSLGKGKLSSEDELLSKNEYLFVSQLKLLFLEWFNYPFQTRIVGGENTGVNEYSMMAGIVDAQLDQVFCGGSIISNKHVLTAAHCLRNREISDLGVLIGDHDLSTGTLHMNIDILNV